MYHEGIHIGTVNGLVCNTSRQKGVFMKERVLKRMNEEFASYRMYLVSGALTAEELFDEAYQIVLKQGIMEAVERLEEESRLCEATWSFLNRKENILEYLYQLWMDCDFSLVSELKEVLYNELVHDREVYGCE